MAFWLLLLLCCVGSCLGTTIRGIPLEKASFYVEGKTFTCLDGSDTIPFNYVNDDYCDCSDGSDEPGTSACPNSVFFCPNKGYRSTYLISSRVNDNYCDCCDGSDEWGTSAPCKNTCDELGSKAREEYKKKQEEYSAGYDKMLEYSLEGQQTKEKYEADLKQLESDVGVIDSEIASLREAKEAAEEPETKAKDKHREEWEQVVASRKAATREEHARKSFDWLDRDSDGRVTSQEIMSRPELDNDGDGEVSQEEASHYLDELESVDFKEFLERVYDVIAVNQAKREEEKQEEREREREVKEDGDGDEEDDDDDDDDENDKEEKKEKEESEEMPPYDEATQELMVAADKARKEFSEAESRKRDLEQRRNDIQKYLGMDFGKSEQFGPLYEKCYEYTDREYTYKLCLFQKVSQHSKSGGRDTSLGNWEKWEESPEKGVAIMRYTNGEKCWNGPSRSTVITLRCGVEEKIISAGEPNRCEYAMEFLTPAMCLERSPPHLYPHVEL